MRTGSVNRGLSSLLHRRLMCLMHRSVCEPRALSVDFANIWHTRFDDYVIVQCVMLNGLEMRQRRHFWNVMEHMRCSKGWNWDFRLVPTSRGIRPPTSFLAYKLRDRSSIVELVLRLSGYNNHLNRVGVNLPDEIVMFLQSHLHQATRASWWTITYQG